MTEKVKNCLKIANNDKAMNCILDAIGNQAKETCPARFVLLYSQNCPPCETEEARLRESIEKGMIRKVSIESPEGIAIAAKNEIGWTPALLILDCHNSLILED